jgi:hypothetical protein
MDNIGLDRRIAAQATEEGIQRADEHAIAAWKQHADQIIRLLAESQPTFTSEDVWAAGLPPNPTGSNAALGGRFRAASTAGLIVATGTTAGTLAHGKHGSHTQVWASRICNGTRHAAAKDADIVAEAAELRRALAVLYWCTRRHDMTIEYEAVRGTRKGDLMAVHAHVANLLDRKNPWKYDAGEAWLAEWLRQEITDNAPGMI